MFLLFKKTLFSIKFPNTIFSRTNERFLYLLFYITFIFILPSFFLAQIMNAIKAVDDILRPKSPSTNLTHQYSDLNLTESQSQEKRTTLIKMAGSSSGTGGTSSNEISPPTASFQETSAVSHLSNYFPLTLFLFNSRWHF